MIRGPTKRRLERWGWLAAASLLLSGCLNPPPPQASTGDPLRGDQPPIPTAPTPTATAKTTEPDGKPTGPPAPVSRPSNSAAALAASTSTSKINDPDPLTGPDPRTTSTAPDWKPSTETASIVLHGPQALDGPSPTLSSAPSTKPGVARGVTPASATVANVDSFQNAQNLLRSIGATSQVLETVGDTGKWHFLCRIPDPVQPSRLTVYEATVAGEDGLAAMRAVLHQIEQEKH
jgi:hypothetical protein